MSVVQRTLFTIAACTCFAAAPAAAFQAQPGIPKGFNVLDASPQKLSMRSLDARNRAFEGLKLELGGVQPKLEWQRNGSFALLRNADVGAPLLRGFARPEAVSAEKAARAFVSRHAGLFGLDGSSLSTLVVDKNEVVGRTDYAKGVYYVSFVQKVGGIRVHQARVSFAIHVETGDLYAVTSNVFGAPTRDSVRNFKLSPQQGVAKVLAAIGITGRAGALTREGDGYRVRVDSDDLTAPVTVKRSFLSNRPGQLVPAYVALVWTKDQGLIEVGVDASAGRHLWSNPLTHWYSYKMSGWSEYPLDSANQILSPTLLSRTPDAVASPSGWLSAKGTDGYYRTIGPNVIVFYDWEALYNEFEYDDRVREFTAPHTSIANAGTSSEVVSFDYVSQWPSDDPHTYVQLSMVEIFQRLNELHDRYYKLGFTDTQGNFQGDDPVLVNAQDGADVGTENNANFSTPPDGTSGRMNMYVFTDKAGEVRDGTMDQQIFNHELGHGLHHRLVNFGDNALYGAQSGALGEGTADTFAFFSEPADDDTFALATYVGWEYFTYVQRGPAVLFVTEDFANNREHPMGRFTNYTYDLGSESITDIQAQRSFEHFGMLPIVDIHNGASGNRFTGFKGNWSYMVYPETHSDGEIWAAATWRVRNRVANHAWTSTSTANRLLGLEQTMLMGMQIMPSNPTFLQARDGLIIYEEMTQTDSAACMIKFEFARTGMGKNATAGADGNYGAGTDYDEATGSFPLMTTDFSSWGCAIGQPSNQASGDVTMIFSAAVPEVEINKTAGLYLAATTPGYNTKATVTGPFLGTVTVQSTTDTLLKTLNYKPTTVGNATFNATVTSTQGSSKTGTVTVEVVDPIDLPAADYTVSSHIVQGDNHHYRIPIDSATFAVGETLTATLHSVEPTGADEIDIDLYFNVDTLALPGANIGYDADADGEETLIFERTAEGFTVSNASGIVFDLEPAASTFGYYLGVAGFSESDYTFTLARD